jgi:hypothetical protein
MRRAFGSAVRAVLAIVLGSFCVPGLVGAPRLASAEPDVDRLYEPVFREGEPGEPLVDGDPPLRREHLDAFVQFTEAAFDLSVPATREQELRDALENGFAASGKERREGLLAAVRPWSLVKERAARGDAQAVRDALAAFRREIDGRLEDLPRARASAILREILALRGETAWNGQPPVHGVAATAWLETAQFLASLGRNEDVAATEGQLGALRQDLGACLAVQPPEVRERIGRAHRLWIVAKTRWIAADEAQRFKMRWEAVRRVARYLPRGHDHAVAPGPELKDYAREASVVALGVSGYDAMANLARNPLEVFDALEKGLGVPKDLPDSVLYSR